MSGYLISPEAYQDIFDIWSYLAGQAGIQLANQLEAELFDDFVLLAQNPGIGHTREDLTKLPVRFYRVFPYQYMIIYRQGKTDIEIVAVLHAKRNVKKILKQRQ